MSGKKLINNPESVVDEALEGLKLEAKKAQVDTLDEEEISKDDGETARSRGEMMVNDIKKDSGAVAAFMKDVRVSIGPDREE